MATTRCAGALPSASSRSSCDAERALLRRRDRSEQLVVDFREQVRQADEAEPGLGGRRARREHAEASRAGELHARFPERRLADPGLALEHERACAGGDRVEEALDDGELAVTPDEHAS